MKIRSIDLISRVRDDGRSRFGAVSPGGRPNSTSQRPTVVASRGSDVDPRSTTLKSEPEFDRRDSLGKDIASLLAVAAFIVGVGLVLGGLIGRVPL